MGYDEPLMSAVDNHAKKAKRGSWWLPAHDRDEADDDGLEDPLECMGDVGEPEGHLEGISLNKYGFKL